MDIIYRRLDEIKPNPDNPRKAKPHGVEELAESIKNNPDYFEARPILLSNRTGELVIIGGERRSEAARYLGMQEVPTILIPNLTEERERELMLKDNVHTGVWDEKKLQEVIELAGEWAKNAKKTWDLPRMEVEKDKYTRKIEPPTYEPKMGTAPNVSELYDTKKCEALLKAIDAEKIPAEIKAFLRCAAYRHIVFDFEKIAEYYAHAGKKVQTLMEDSALVIIDFERAIGGGYVQMCKDLLKYCEE